MTERRPLAPEDLWRLARVGHPEPLPDGERVVVPVTTYDLDENEGTTHLWLVSAGGEPIRLTSADATVPVIDPSGRHLAFLRKEGEEEKRQLHVMPLHGGEAKRVTDLPLGVKSSRWLPDGSGLVILAEVLADSPDPEQTRERLRERKEDPVSAHVTENRVYRFWDRWLTKGEVPHLFVFDLDTEELRDLIPDSRRWFDFLEPGQDFDVSPDGRWVAFAADASQPPHDRLRLAIYLVPTAGGEVRSLTPDHPASDTRPRFFEDGLVFGMQREWDFYADRVRLVRYDLERDVETVLTEDWDRSASSWEIHDDQIVFMAEDRGRNHLYRLPLKGGREPELLAEGGTIVSPRPSGSHIYARYDDLSHPPEICRVPLEGGKPELITDFNDDLLDGIELGDVEEIEVPGADQRSIQVYVVYPPGFDHSHRWPLVHMIHGGPHGTFGDQWHYRWNAQAFAAPGYVVACVNFHGSTSWGQDFAAVIHGAWGDKPATDVLAATDALIERGFIDPERMAITGGSYGGYLTAWLTTQTDRFVTAVCHAGVIDLIGQYASDITQGRARSMGGEPWEDLDAILRWSPAAHAKGWSTPMLVVHGEQDFRVPVTQGLELYNILKGKGVEARLVYYPDENHWILKPRNSIHWYGEVLGWLERFLS